MSTPEPTHSQAVALTPLPSIDDLPRTRDGSYEADAVRDNENSALNIREQRVLVQRSLLAQTSI